MKTITDLIKECFPKLTPAQLKRFAELMHPDAATREEEQYESLSPTAESQDKDENETYQILNLTDGIDGGQYLVSWKSPNLTKLRLVHCDTLLFPLPVSVILPENVQRDLSEQLVQSLATGSGIPLNKVDIPLHATALRGGYSDLPLLRGGGQRGMFSWMKGLFDRDNDTPAVTNPEPPSSEKELNDHLLTVAEAQVNILSSKEGPDGGNLACVWAVDKIFEIAFDRRLTRSLSTAVIDEELSDGKGRLVEEKKARPGHIIISPTGTGNGHGHIGILGKDGKIYSNSSSRARWEQNHTLASWKKRYVEDKKMALRFYQVLPKTAGVRASAALGARASLTTACDAISVRTISSEANSALAGIDRYWAAKRAEDANVRGAGIPLVAEGDSWFDFKITRDVIDWLEKDYRYDISNVAKAGACLYEMAYGEDNDQLSDLIERDPSQLAEVVRLIHEKKPRAVLLSGAGNDFVGPEFIMLIHHVLAKPTGVNAMVVQGLFDNEIEPAFRRVIATVKAAAEREGLGDIPILVHGYDYVFPDNRTAANFLIKRIGPWMGPSFEMKGYPLNNAADLEKRRALVRVLIDRVYEMHAKIARDFSNIHIVDLRNTLTNVSDWHDELHPSRDGFRRVATKFHETLTHVLARSAVQDTRATVPRGLDLQAEINVGVAPIQSADASPPYQVRLVERGLDYSARPESSASLNARAEDARNRENIDRWTRIDPIRGLDYLEQLRERIVDDTQGLDSVILTRSFSVQNGWDSIETTLSESLRWVSSEGTSTRGGAVRSIPTLDQLRSEYLNLYQTCVIRPANASTVDWYKNRINAGRTRYQAIGQELNIPWEFIAVTHSLEASNDFSKHLHNGDPLSARTVRVPAGRIPDVSPPYSFEQSARDAMKMKNYHLQSDWSIEAVLYRLERYNGWGYRGRGIHTPYLWSFSNHYTKGKFVSDGVFDKNAVSRQAGAAVLLKTIDYP